MLVQLIVETLRTKQLISLRLDLQVLVLHDIFDKEFAIANFADVATFVCRATREHAPLISAFYAVSLGAELTK